MKDNKNNMISRGLVIKCTTRAINSHDENVMESIKSRDKLFIKIRNLLSSVPSVLARDQPWVTDDGQLFVTKHNSSWLAPVNKNTCLGQRIFTVRENLLYICVDSKNKVMPRRSLKRMLN